MGRSRAIQLVMLIAPVMLVAGGCANLRLPAIDPTGRSLFLPNPNYTTLARDGFLSRLHGGDGTGIGGRLRQLHGGLGLPGANASQLPGPYEPALFNRHREQLGQLFRNGANRLGGLHDGTRRLLTGLHGNGGGLFNHDGGLFNRAGRTPATLFGNSAYPRVPSPPGCGPNGQAPAGSPCYPVGSPTDSSLAATLGQAGRVGSGLNPNCSGGLNGPSGSSQFAQVGPGVVIGQPRYTARVGDEIVILGGLLSNSGIARGGEAVKWSLSNR